MKYFNPILSVVFILAVAFAPIIAQEEEEATGQEEAITEEEAVQEETAVEEEAVVEEAAAEAVEEAVEEEVEIAAEEEAIEEIAEAEEALEAEVAKPGFVISAALGGALISGDYLASGPIGFGVILQTPLAIPLGPITFNLGLVIATGSGEWGGDKDASVLEIWPSVSFQANDIVPLPVPLTLYGGAGIFGEGIGLAAGAGILVNALIPQKLPVIITVGANGNLLTDIDGASTTTFYLRGYVTVGYPLPM